MAKIAAGNWKMNGTSAALDELSALIAAWPQSGAEIMICPPATLISRAADIAQGSTVVIGAQDCATGLSGAHTGDISAPMLIDAGAQVVIIGHSERRQNHFESDAVVRAKLETALTQGLRVILCIGESLEQRQSGQCLPVLEAQVKAALQGLSYDPSRLIIAYEPIWAIGSGLTPSMAEIAEVHLSLHQLVSDPAQSCHGQGTNGADLPLLYGGSVKPSNAAEIFALPHVDGALVGGASLKAEDFSAIIRALNG